MNSHRALTLSNIDGCNNDELKPQTKNSRSEFFFLPGFQNQHKMGDPAKFGFLIGIDPVMLGSQMQWVLYEAAS